MAERVELEKEVVEILDHINHGDNFLLSGGAGSGKTYSLVQLINRLIFNNSKTRIACLTYTNAAVREIEERVNHSNLTVSTIHDFLWSNIKHFQKELKDSLIYLLNDETSKIKNPEDTPITNYYFDDLVNGIEYKEYTKIKYGKVSHDEVLILANHLFKKYPKLCDILKDKYPFILIDEYQDTSVDVIEILLVHLRKSKKKNIVGFFGDSMQSIYEHTIGDLNKYLDSVKEVKKTQNRRNPQKIIDLANHLRTDNIMQTHSDDDNAPNMLNGIVKKGDIKFYYSENNDLENLKKNIDWNFEEQKETKILNLTHNLIAPSAGFENLIGIYSGDKIVAFKQKIKKYIKTNNILTDYTKRTFGEVIDNLSSQVYATAMMNKFIDSNPVLYNYARSQNYELFSKIYLDKDQLIDDKKQDREEESKKGSKRDDLIKHLFKIQCNVSLYNDKNYNEFIRKTEYEVLSTQDKIDLKRKIEGLSSVENMSIDDVIDKADKYGICKKDDKLQAFISENKYVFDRVKKVEFVEFQRLYKYLEGYTPFSTKHKTKGGEFNNVLVILDNGGWNNYNFEKLFTGGAPATVESRTQKIFYVCCTRAKENLAVFFHKPKDGVLVKAREWFEPENVISI